MHFWLVGWLVGFTGKYIYKSFKNFPTIRKSDQFLYFRVSEHVSLGECRNKFEGNLNLVRENVMGLF